MDNILDWTNANSSTLVTPLKAQSIAATVSDEGTSVQGSSTNKNSPPLNAPSAERISPNGAYGKPSKSEDDAQVPSDASTLTNEKKNVGTKSVDFLRRVEMYRRNREARIRACRQSMDKSAKEARKFRAKPAPKFSLTKKIANTTRKTTRQQPFQLRTAERAEQRKQFERQLQEKQKVVERILADKRRKAEELEAEQIREIRKRTVIRARPILCELPPRRQKKDAD